MKKIFFLLPSILLGMSIASSASALTVVDSNVNMINSDPSRYEIDVDMTDGDVSGPIELLLEYSTDQKNFNVATPASSSQKTEEKANIIQLDPDARPQMEIESRIGESLATKIYFDWLASEDLGERTDTIRSITLRMTLFENGEQAPASPSKYSQLTLLYGPWTRPVEEPIKMSVDDLGAYGTPKQLFALTDGNIYRSEDGVTNYEKIFTFSNSTMKASMRFASNKNTVYAFTNESTNGGDDHMVAMSSDGGSTWEEIGGTQTGAIRDALIFEDQLYAIMDYWKDNPMANGTYHQSKVFRSSDNEAT